MAVKAPPIEPTMTGRRWGKTANAEQIHEAIRKLSEAASHESSKALGIDAGLIMVGHVVDNLSRAETALRGRQLTPEQFERIRRALGAFQQTLNAACVSSKSDTPESTDSGDWS